MRLHALDHDDNTVRFYSASERCISYMTDSVCLSVTLLYYVSTTPATIMRISLEASPMTLVSSWLTSARNSKGNIGSEGTV